MSVVDMTPVTECTVTDCSYNHDGCHAFAVTVGQDSRCATFVPLDVKGGLSKVVSQVGACQRTACLFNKDLECSAASVRIGGIGSDVANCLTYTEA
ncbi:DUF1540 domain-containing protein [Brachybacterium hainanense]|uniref:DUF1540 domain-containing protein n=1 Tax=Brachybacterium hainanense TaxID=1541174 RepID=A0ABV6RDE8_9MICO